MRLRGKVAIITGGGSGIGKASAVRFAREGARVAVTGRRAERLDEVVKEIGEIGGEAFAIPSDVSKPADAEHIVRQTVDHLGGLDILFNNAATVDLHKTVAEMTIEEWDMCINATLRSIFLLAKWAAPEMAKAGGGSIINCGSVGGTMAWRGGAAYCAAKGGVLQLTKVLAIEYGPWKIRVNTLSPGAIMTPNLEKSIERSGDDSALRAKSVFHRIGEPEEVAGAALFLASDDSSFVTASNLVVDGGYLTI